MTENAVTTLKRVRLDFTGGKISSLVVNGATWTVNGSRWPQVHWTNTVQATAQEKNRRPVVTAWAGMFPMRRPKKPAMAAPSRGAKTPRMTRV